MQEPHLERPFILGPQADPRFLEELPNVRLEPNVLRRLPAAGGSGLDEFAVADVTGAREPLDILESVITTESATGCSNSLTGFALLGLPLSRMLQRGKTSEIKPRQWVQALP